MFEFFTRKKEKLRKEKYREDYRQKSESERDAYMELMVHYSVYGGPFRNKALIEMCEAARAVEAEEDS